MPLNRPPLMSRGQANDFYAYTTIGTGLMFLAGGLAAGPAAIALGLCGLGAAANNRRESGRCGWRPEMVFQPPAVVPPGPLSNLDWTQEEYDRLDRIEARLKRDFGMNAVHCFRMMITEGHPIGGAEDVLRTLLASLKSNGYWSNGAIDSGDLTPKQLLDQITGRRVASFELQQWFHPQYFPGFYQAAAENSIRKGEHPDVQQRHLIDISLMIYILGLTPISDKPVRRIKWWVDRYSEKLNGHPLYFVSDWDWFVGATVEALRDRWEWVVNNMMRKHGMPQYLADEADDLWHYRVEPHRGDAPPGHPGGVLISSVLFGRTKSFPATEEDMRGIP